MRRRLLFWEAAGFLFTGALGVLLRFSYGWSGGSAAAAAFSGVNGSTWEHMKLLFLPLFLFSVVQVCLMGRNYPNLPAVRAVSALTGLALIPVLFYTCTGVLGRSWGWVNAAIFFLADLAVFALDFRLLLRGRFSAGWQQVLGLAALWGLVFCFVWCTFRPVRLPLWRDPVTGAYGIPYETPSGAFFAVRRPIFECGYAARPGDLAPVGAAKGRRPLASRRL